MKILWLPQISSVSKIDHSWLLDTDSNINLMRRFKNLLPDEMVTVSPEPLHFIETRVEPDLFTKNSIFSRFHFDADKWYQIIRDIDPDIVVNNTVELTRNFDMLRRHTDLDFKLFSYNHWVAFQGTTRLFMDLQIDAAKHCDVYFLQTNWCIKNFGVPDARKLSIPWYDIKTEQRTGPFKVLWPHRISTHPYYANQFERWQPFLEKLGDAVTYSNPTVSRENPATPISYLDFRRRLRTFDIVVPILDSPIQWVLNMQESIEAGAPSPIMYIESYPEMVNREYPFIFDTEKQIQSYVRLLSKAPSILELHRTITIDDSMIQTKNVDILQQWKEAIEYVG